MKYLYIILVCFVWSGLNAQYSGNAIEFSAGDYVNCGTDTSLNMSQRLTMEAWVFLAESQPGQYPRLIDKYNYILHQGYNLILINNGTVPMFEFWGDDNLRHNVAADTSINDSTWHHLAVTFNDTIQCMYVDGRLAGQTIGESHTIIECGNIMGLGNNSDGNIWHPFKGKMDEVRIWNVARLHQQIVKTMWDTLSPAYYSTPDSGLVGYWRFDQLEDLGIGEDGQDDVRDLSYNGNHGDLVGSARLVVSDLPTSLRDPLYQIPHKFSLFQNYPNPFNPVTMIKYQIPINSDVELSIYNLLGQKVTTMVNEHQQAGFHQVEWDASGISSGVYFYQLVSGEYREVRKMMLLR
jgi:hypothetical protein